MPAQQADEGKDAVAIEGVDELQRQLGRMEKWLAALDAHAAVSTTNRDGVITHVNDRFCELAGYTRAELLGHTHRIVKSDIHPPSFHDELWATICAGRTWRGDICNRHKDGGHYWVRATISPIVGDEGQIEEFVSIRTDITEGKAKESALAEAKAVAERALQAKTEFLSVMSHEIRTPMNGVIGMLDLLAGTPLDPEQQEYLQLAGSSAETLLGIIDDILDLSKIEAGRMPIESVALDPAALLEECAEQLKPRANAKGLRLCVEIDPGLPPLIVGDPLRLRQIVLNLLSNAVKFTETGRIELAAARCADTGQWRIAVRDTGIGIAAQTLPHLFKPFTQADSSTTRRFGGTGLGLVIVDRLAALMGGAVSVDSTLGAGTTFALELPLVAAEVHTTERMSLLHKRLLLVAAADDPYAGTIARYAVAWGMAVTRATRWDDAAPLWEGRGADALVCVAGLWGEAARPPEVSRHGPCILVEPVPGNGRRRAAQAGGWHVLSAPIRQSSLADALVSSALPAAPGPAARTPMLEHVLPDLSACRVLLVEDNTTNQQVAVKMLMRFRCDVSVACDGAEAVDRFRAERFDLVLMDMQMPVMDGLAATRAIRAIERERAAPRTPVVAMTANVLEGDRERCLAAGMDDYISKPIDLGRLQGMLSAWLAVAPPTPPTPPAALSALPPEAGPPAIVWARLAEFFGDDDDAMLDLLRVFLGGARRTLTRLGTALRERSADAQDLAHELKGSAGNVGADRLAAVATCIDDALKQGDWLAAEACLPDLRGAMQAVEAAVDGRRLASAGRDDPCNGGG